MSGVYGDEGKKKKRIAIISISSLILVVMVVVGAVVGLNHKAGDSTKTETHQVSASMKAVQAICQPTDYRATCEKSLSEAAGNTTDPKELIKVAFKVAMGQISEAVKRSSVLQELEKDPRASQALQNCRELMDYAINDLQQSFDKLGIFDVSKLDDFLADLKIWISASITYQETCLDGFQNTTGTAGEKMRKALNASAEMTSNGLAIVSEIYTVLTSLDLPILNRRLLSDDLPVLGHSDEFPSWLNNGKRRLLAATPAKLKPDVIVAKDGSGKHKTINDALLDIPKNGSKTFVIHIKEGVYKEHVLINKSMTHVMMIGDGPTKTKITGNKNFVDGIPTFKTATVAVLGDFFVAKDIGFENSAGPEKHQAVALRVQSDMSVFYNCHMDGYQDTLYVHAKRQFYRDCTVSGTIDFIFGDGAAIFQNCKLVVRKPMDNQQCIVTAQGRKEKRQPSALVLQNCTITGDPLYMPFKDVNKAFLGRPWKEYSRTIIMESYIDSIIQPEGWLAWMGDFALKTLFYSEYHNRGPGSSLVGRVKWRGIKTLTPQHALDFTVEKFVRGDTWIPATRVPYASGMIKP
jgi:pectinesterase